MACSDGEHRVSFQPAPPLSGIAAAPPKVRCYDLQEVHTYLLASAGKDRTGHYQRAFRVSAARAWGFPEVEVGRTGTSIPALVFDMDGDPTDWLVDVLGPDMYAPAQLDNLAQGEYARAYSVHLGLTRAHRRTGPAYSPALACPRC